MECRRREDCPNEIGFRSALIVMVLRRLPRQGPLQFKASTSWKLFKQEEDNFLPFCTSELVDSCVSHPCLRDFTPLWVQTLFCPLTEMLFERNDRVDRVDPSALTHTIRTRSVVL